ncbi:MAG: AbrB/MazE/SpoVT family DNA-binding domain-containing protein [Panacagrimonas sp.]
MSQATLTSKGQLVIPQAIRKALHVKPGTRFEVSIEGERIILAPATAKTLKLDDWLPAMRQRRQTNNDDLCRPVDEYGSADMAPDTAPASPTRRRREVGP